MKINYINKTEVKLEQPEYAGHYYEAVIHNQTV